MTATFHNYFTMVPITDETVMAFISFAKGKASWGLIDDMLDKPAGSLRRHVEDMISREILAQSEQGLVCSRPE